MSIILGKEKQFTPLALKGYGCCVAARTGQEEKSQVEVEGAAH